MKIITTLFFFFISVQTFAETNSLSLNQINKTIPSPVSFGVMVFCFAILINLILFDIMDSECYKMFKLKQKIKNQ